MKKINFSGTLVLAIAGWLFVQTSTAADSRHALVIGNNDYQNARKLINPTNDANVMAQSLKKAGFEITLATDANLKAMKAAVREFVRSLPEDGIALIFFAGHGVEVKGQNYLIPVDADMAEEYEVPDETVSMNSILRGLEQAKTSLNILVLDCCRDDPYSRSWRGARSANGAGGLSMPADMPQGMFIAFSTTPGKTAEDGDGNNSPFSAALAEELIKPGQELERVFKNVGAKVAQATEQRQEPWSNSKFYGTFVFNPAAPKVANTTAAPPAPGKMAAVVAKPVTAPRAAVERIVMQAPPFAETLASDGAGVKRNFVKLDQVSAKDNGVGDIPWEGADYLPPTLEVPNMFRQIAGNLPANVPPKLDGLIVTRAMQDHEGGYIIYGRNFSEGTILTIWDPEFKQQRAELDFSAYTTAPKVIQGDEGFVNQAASFAAIRDGILYVSHFHMTYAKSSGGMNGYITAIDLASGKLLWRSRPLVCNSHSFVISEDAIICGYGFTAEDDFMFVLDRHTGKVVSTTKVKSGPERIAMGDGVLYVRTYNTDYKFLLMAQ